MLAHEVRQILWEKRLNLNVLLAIALLFCPQVRAESGSADAVKVAFLFNVLKFIEWPAETRQDAFNLCTSDKDAFGDKFLVLRGKTIDGKPINLFQGVGIDALKTCHLVFVGARENPTGIMRKLKGLPVVTISDKTGFVGEGGMVGLVLEDNRLKFEVNLQATKQSGIRIFATLLKLAKTVVGEN